MHEYYTFAYVFKMKADAWQKPFPPDIIKTSTHVLSVSKRLEQSLMEKSILRFFHQTFEKYALSVFIR